MKVLFVEDEKEFAENTVGPRLERAGLISITFAAEARSAIELLNLSEVDYVILDQAIPSARQAIPIADTVYGQQVFHHIRSNFPGLPVMILSAQSTEDIAEEMLESPSMQTFWNGRRQNLLKIRRKKHLDQAVDIINSAAAELKELDEVELELPHGCEPCETSKRIIKIFCRENGGMAARVSPINGGLSGSSVYSVLIFDKSKSIIQQALAKIGKFTKVGTEIENYNKHVVRLCVGAYPVFLDSIYFGNSQLMGVFYRLAEEYGRNFFDLINDDPRESINIVNALRQKLSIWHDAKNGERQLVGDIRRCLLKDEKIQGVYQFILKDEIDSIEKRFIQVNSSIQHKDFHGANVLVSSNNIPIIIDYGDVNFSPASMDPIALELACLFHPSHRNGWKPTVEQIGHWFDDEVYFAFSPYPDLLKEIRSWAREQAYMKKEIAAVVYAYGLKQLLYPDSDTQLALALVNSAIKELKK